MMMCGCDLDSESRGVASLLLAQDASNSSVGEGKGEARTRAVRDASCLVGFGGDGCVGWVVVVMIVLVVRRLDD